MNNGYNVYVNADAVRKCLDKDRQKENNIILVGQTNCRKSFLWDPLELNFKTFGNPALAYAWVRLDKCGRSYFFNTSQHVTNRSQNITQK